MASKIIKAPKPRVKRGGHKTIAAEMKMVHTHKNIEHSTRIDEKGKAHHRVEHRTTTVFESPADKSHPSWQRSY